MVRQALTATACLVIASCIGQDPEVASGSDGLHASSAPSGSVAPEIPVVAPPQRAASVAVAQQGYDDAELVVSPPAPGTTVRSLRLTRPELLAAELEQRLVGMLAVMDLEIEPAQASAWAQEALADEEVSIAEPVPDLVVTYDPWLDDLAVVHTGRLDGGIGQQSDDVPWSVAGEVLDALIDRGVVDRSLTIDEAEVSFVRSGIKGPGGRHDQWVDEVRFEANAMVNDIRVLDAGLRIGITPSHEVSSLRVTYVDVEQLDPVFIEAAEVDLRDSFAEHVVGSTNASLASVHVSERRPVYVLEPEASSEIVLPQYMMSYALTTVVDDSFMSSRAKVVFIGLINPQPLVELELP